MVSEPGAQPGEGEPDDLDDLPRMAPRRDPALLRHPAFTRAEVDERERAAYERGKAAGIAARQAEVDDAEVRASRAEEAVAESYARGLAEGRTQGLNRAATAVRSQANLPDLIHFDRPSDFRKGVLSCLAALEALEGKPDA